jgi:hypothetical protein
MIKAIVSYSKKLPVPEADFSSQGYSLSLETEVPDTEPNAIRAKLHSTFELVKAAVEDELAGNALSAPAIPAKEPAKSDKASNAQIKFLTDLCGQRGIALSQLNQQIRTQFGVGGLYDLTRKQCSEILDDLNGKRRKAA